MTISAEPACGADLDAYCSIQGLSQLTPAVVLQQGPDLVLLDRTAGGVRSRASLWWRQVPRHGDRPLGFIGHYAALDAESGADMLRLCCRTLAGEGCRLAVGPLDGSTWRRYRLMTMRGTEPTFFLEPDNPDSWPRHFEAAGFASLARYFSSLDEDNARGLADGSVSVRHCEEGGYRLRPLAVGALEAELAGLWRLSCEGFRDNFLYSEIPEPEFLAQYQPLLARVPPELVCIAEWQGIPVAFCLGLPDLLQLDRQRRIDTVIIKSLAVIPAHRRRGLGAALVARVNANARARGMHRTIHALMHEANPSRRISRGLMRDFRRYTLYGRAL